MSKSGILVGKIYHCDSMFKLGANVINYASGHTIVSDSYLWNTSLGHLNFGSLNYMFKNSYITCKPEHRKKCEICIRSKMIKKLFYKIERFTKILHLVHSDLCELNGELNRGGKRYFITFIDDFSIFKHV